MCHNTHTGTKVQKQVQQCLLVQKDFHTHMKIGTDNKRQRKARREALKRWRTRKVFKPLQGGKVSPK